MKRSYPAAALLVLLCGTTSAQEAVEAPVSASSTTAVEPTLKLAGNRTTTVRYQHYSGLSPAASGFYQSGFTRHETTRLKLSGQALEKVKVEGEIYQNDVDLDNQYSLRLATKHYELFLGEFPATFEGSEFTVFSRQLQGAKLTGNVPLGNEAASRMEFILLGSSPRGEPKYQKFFGADTQGPYQLQSFPVVLGSEQVKVDKVRQVRNVDYEINYITGTLTFKKRIIESRSLVEVFHEARQALYSRALYGGQVGYWMTDYDSISLIAADERDNRNAGVYASYGIPATAHTVLGATLKHDGEFMRIGGEYGRSIYDPDRFAAGMKSGNAFKGEMELERFGLLAGGDFKRVEPEYRTLGNTGLGSDFLGWSAHGGLGLGRFFKAQGRHDQQSVILDGSRDRLKETDAKTELHPKGWPRETYRYYQSGETYEYNYERLEKRHTANISHDFKHLRLDSGYERDDIVFRDGSQPDRVWDAGRAGLGITGVKWLAASLSGELRRGEESSSIIIGSRKFRTVLATANAGFTPHERYYLGGANNWDRTSGQPARNTLRTEAKARPDDRLSAQANYSQETLRMFYVDATHPARTDSYSGLAEIEPVRSVSLVYQPSLRQTMLTGVKPAVNYNRRDGYTAKWSASSYVSAEGSYVNEDYRLLDNNDPALQVLTSQGMGTWNCILRLAPVEAFTSQLGYTDGKGLKSQLNPAVPGLYDKRDTRRQTARVGIRPQLESRLGLDAGYRFERYRQIGSQGPSLALPLYSISPVAQQIAGFSQMTDYTWLHTYEHTVNAGATYQVYRTLIPTVTCSYDLRQDRTGRLGSVETMAVGAGLTFRIRQFRIEGTYRLARSRGGADTSQQAMGGSMDWVPAPQVRWTARAEYGRNDRPVSSNTDITSSLEVSF